MESDLLNLKNEQMGLLERVSLLELTSRHYEEQFDATQTQNSNHASTSNKQ